MFYECLTLVASKIIIKKLFDLLPIIMGNKGAHNEREHHKQQSAVFKSLPRSVGEPERKRETSFAQHIKYPTTSLLYLPLLA